MATTWLHAVHSPARSLNGRRRLATSCRTRWRSCMRTRRSCARTCSPARASVNGLASGCKRRHGTGSGTAGPSSTTARRWARRTTWSAGSTRSRRAGRCSRASAARSARSRRWTPSRRGWCGPRRGWCSCSTPPFDRQGPNPGYIAGYAPGVCENGGQYTRVAVWAAMAFASLGDPVRAWLVTVLILPAHHGRLAKDVAVYKVEPYVVAAVESAME